jgi:Bacterial Ig-like domain (group 3)/FG-GAP-like repeat
MTESSLCGFGRRHFSLPAICLVASFLIGATGLLALPAKGTVRRARSVLPAASGARSPEHRAPGLPFDRVIRPGLQRQLAKVRPARKRSLSTPATLSSTLPNFGGFLAAAKFQAFDVHNEDNSSLSVFASGDFNKDGKQDLAIVQSSGSVNVMLNKGGGFFDSPIGTFPSAYVGGAVQAVGIDVNKDGNDDLVLVDSYNNAVDVLLSKGDGTFSDPQMYTAGSNSVVSVAAGDVNGDGFPDLVLLSSSQETDSSSNITTTIELDTLLNDGKGGFLSPSGPLQLIFSLAGEYDTVWGRSIALTDVNGDGIPDVTIESLHWIDIPTPLQDSEHVIMTLTGAGRGAYTEPVLTGNVVVPSLSTFNSGYPIVANLNVVDINKDGIKDIVFSYQDYFIWAALGNGDGTYQPAYNVGAYKAYPTDLMVADINGNGLPALIDAEPGFVGVYSNLGNGVFDTSTIPFYGSGVGQFAVLAVADFNGDGTPDVALMNADEGSVTLFTGVPGTSPSLRAATLINPQMGNAAGVIGQAVLDANGDGNDDVVLFNTLPSINNPELTTALGDGVGGFVFKNALPSYIPAFDDFVDQATGDFNGDGKMDLVLHTDRGVSVLLSNGDGTFTPKPVQLPSFSCITAKGAIGDLNGDGKLDLVVAYGGDAANPECNTGTTPSGVFILLGNGDGTFQPAKLVAVGDEVYEPILLDADGDGKLDLVVSDLPISLLDLGISASFKTFLLIGNGDGTFKPPTTLVNDNVNVHTMAGDVNGDGKTDLVILSAGAVDTGGYIDPTTAGVLVLLANGDGTYATQPLLLPGFFPSGGLLADINGDGKPDLVLSESTSYDFTDPVIGTVAALGNGDGTFTPVSNFEGGDASSILLEGDFLKDGYPDVVSVSTVSGSSLILNQGGTSVTLAANPTSIQQGQSVSITAVVKASMAGRPQPTGNITLMEGSTSLGTGTLSGGSATISVSGLAVGTHSITAVYSGDGNFNMHSGATVSVQVTAPPPAPSVTISSSATSLSLTRGQTGTITFTAMANSTFSGNITFAVAGAPAGMSVSFTPSQLALTPGQSATAVLVVSTTSSNSQLQWPLSAGGGTALAALFLLVVPRRLRRKISALAMIAIVGLLTTVLGLTSCGGSSVKVAPRGTTTLTVTATPAGLSALSIPVTVSVE